MRETKRWPKKPGDDKEEMETLFLASDAVLLVGGACLNRAAPGLIIFSGLFRHSYSPTAHHADGCRIAHYHGLPAWS